MTLLLSGSTDVSKNGKLPETEISVVFNALPTNVERSCDES